MRLLLVLAVIVAAIVSFPFSVSAHPAAPAFQNSSENKTLGDTSHVMYAPAGFDAGDLFISYVSKDDDVAIALPGGATWTIIQEGDDLASNGCYLSVAYRIAQAGDTSWTWTGDSEDWWGVILRYTGHDSITPINTSNITRGGTTANPLSPSVDTGRDDCTIVCGFGADDKDTPYTVPGTLTSRWNDEANTTGGAGGDKVLVSQGASGTENFTMNAAEQWVAVTVAIQPPSPDEVPLTPTDFTLTDLMGITISANWTASDNTSGYLLLVNRDDYPSSANSSLFELAYDGELTTANLSGYALETSDFFFSLYAYNETGYSENATTAEIGETGDNNTYISEEDMEEVANELSNFNALISDIMTFLLVVAVIALVIKKGSIILYALGTPLCIVYGLSLAIPGADLSVWVVGVVIAIIGTYFLYQVVLGGFNWLKGKVKHE